MITLNQNARTARSKSLGPESSVRFVDACLHGLVLPKRTSRVHVTKIATWTLEWWPHSRQRALYAAIDAQELTFWPTANGFEMCQLSARFNRYFMVVRREPDRISIEALLSQLPVWGAH